MSETVADDAASSHDKNRTVTGYEESQSSLSSDETQTGVKNIELVSQTWTKWSLVAAYLG